MIEAGGWRTLTLGTCRIACTEAYLSPHCRAHLAERSSCGRRRRPQPGDQRQDVGEHLSRHRYLGHLECDVAPVVTPLVRWIGRSRDRRAVDPVAAESDITAELKRLRRENEILRQERDILKKATAFFAREGSR